VNRSTPRRRAALALAASCALAACATPTAREAGDPIEKFNRPMFAFNDALDRWIFEPVARGWDWITPRTVPVHIDQFFDNLRTPGHALNDLLQGDGGQAGTEAGRFLLNTTVGLVGIFDPASHHFGLRGRPEDFGQTLGAWGTPMGAYVMLPVMGPHGVRELVALPIDLILRAWTLVPGANIVYVINRRSLDLEEIRDIRSGALDLYVTVRNGYQQRRAALIRNGDPSEEGTDDDFYNVPADY
jgi:phospholipid-binding lipoprotein MlaA